MLAYKLTSFLWMVWPGVFFVHLKFNGIFPSVISISYIRRPRSRWCSSFACSCRVFWSLWCTCWWPWWCSSLWTCSSVVLAGWLVCGLCDGVLCVLERVGRPGGRAGGVEANFSGCVPGSCLLEVLFLPLNIRPSQMSTQPLKLALTPLKRQDPGI